MRFFQKCKDNIKPNRITNRERQSWWVYWESMLLVQWAKSQYASPVDCGKCVTCLSEWDGIILVHVKLSFCVHQSLVFASMNQQGANLATSRWLLLSQALLRPADVTKECSLRLEVGIILPSILLLIPVSYFFKEENYYQGHAVQS